ncbi:transposase [Ornithinimicrobium cryptoxanthini]|uniref:Transposase n=1 Tax=Ornithinimicrobium cryptoxanthini TaxID=2934161 RepID=A0ABY4YNF6_9MICO|nr:transposase [Ornithinimicrobium cryptoxanthini]USQ78137.1 transposase [Ornithinimicrobium cryptoxanthini]
MAEKPLRYRFLHVPARLTHGDRRQRPRIPSTWPWATAIVDIFANIAAFRTRLVLAGPPMTSPGEPQPGSASQYHSVPAHTQSSRHDGQALVAVLSTTS